MNFLNGMTSFVISSIEWDSVEWPGRLMMKRTIIVSAIQWQIGRALVVNQTAE
jgi:hypothetical protein